MRPVHLIVIAAAVALLVALYLWSANVPPKKAKDGTAPMVANSASTPHNAVKPASFDSILAAARQGLPEHASAEIKTIENQIRAIPDSPAMAPFFDSLASVWREHKQLPVAAHYYLTGAKLANSEKKLNFAARLFLDGARKDTSEAGQQWQAANAIDGFSRVLKLNPENDTATIGLAECYIGTGETMQGVLMLRDLTTKHPDNVTANLMLGQQGIVSGQYDKAIGRFERVLKTEPKNIEAMLGLAEVYRNTGAREKAVAQLEQAKKTMNNPEFSKDIDEYIKSIK